jgi:hypothetical protein
VKPGNLAAPPTLAFGKVPINKTKTRSITIKNTGVGVLHGNVDAASLNGSSFTVTSGAGAFTLASQQTRVVKVRFGPPATGPFNTSLVITTSDDPAHLSVGVALSGVVKP